MKTCIVCGSRTVEHVNRMDRICVVCGRTSLEARPIPMVFAGDPEDYIDLLMGTIERQRAKK